MHNPPLEYLAVGAGTSVIIGTGLLVYLFRDSDGGEVSEV